MGFLLAINHTDAVILPWNFRWIKENIEYLFQTGYGLFF
jgi:hypothetical protein